MQDGFGCPDNFDLQQSPVSWAELLDSLGAAAGDTITVLVMNQCKLGTLETAIAQGMCWESASPTLWDVVGHLQTDRGLRQAASVCLCALLMQTLQNAAV